MVWVNCNRGLSEKLQRLQNRAARILMSANYNSNMYSNLDDLFRGTRVEKTLLSKIVTQLYPNVVWHLIILDQDLFIVTM